MVKCLYIIIIIIIIITVRIYFFIVFYCCELVSKCWSVLALHVSFVGYN